MLRDVNLLLGERVHARVVHVRGEVTGHRHRVQYTRSCCAPFALAGRACPFSVGPCSLTQSARAKRIGMIVWPSSLIQYSTRGGTSAYTLRWAIPPASSSRSRL